MKIIRVGFLLIAVAGMASAALVLEDGFDYATGPLGENGDWTNPGDGNGLEITDTSLTYGSLSTSGKKATVRTMNGGTGSYETALNVVLTDKGDSLYFSFLVDVRNTGHTGSFHFEVDGDGSRDFAIRSENDRGTPGFTGGMYPNTRSTPIAFSDGVHMIVGNVVKGNLDGTSDQYITTRWWVDPSDASLGSDTPDGTTEAIERYEPTESLTLHTLRLTISGYYATGTFDGNESPDMDVDEIRIGTSWADVTPVMAIVDADGDGLPDAWEIEHYGDITTADGATLCANGVNTANQAYISGISPVDVDALFTLSNDLNVLEWTAVSGRVYNVYSSTNLADGFLPLKMDWPSGVYTDSTANGKSFSFYKIKAKMKP